MKDIKEYNIGEKDDIKQPSMVDKVDELYNMLKDTNKKQIKMPRRAKTKGKKIKKGWFGVLYINEAGNFWGDKAKVEDFVFREKKAVRYHATDGREILYWLGKFPIIVQPTWKKNPLNLRMNEKDDKEKNEVYGQKYIMARMLADVIKIKQGGMKGIIWVIGIAVAAYIGYTLFTGGF